MTDVNPNYQPIIQEQTKEPLLPITESIGQLIDTDILGAINNINEQVGTAYEPEINSFQNMLGDNKYSSATGQIFSGLTDLIGIVPEERLSQIAISVLVNDKISNQVAAILAKNLAKSTNIFLDNFNEGIKERKEELIKEFDGLIDTLSENVGTGISNTVTNAVSGLPPVALVTSVSSAGEAVADALDETINQTEIARSTFLDIVDKTTNQFYDKYNQSGIPELVQLSKDIDKLSKMDPGALIESQLEAQANKVTENMNQAITSKVDTATRAIDNATQIPVMSGGKRVKTAKIYRKKNKNPINNGRKLKSILKTAKRNRKNTRRVRFA